MTDHGLENHPIFIHTFSNGGAFFYTYLIKEFSKQQSSRAFDFRGTIFDSAPFPQSIQLGYRATKAAFGRNSTTPRCLYDFNLLGNLHICVLHLNGLGVLHTGCEF
ncbi:unnamed protein product, partial [Allacma fusca]